MQAAGGGGEEEGEEEEELVGAGAAQAARESQEGAGGGAGGACWECTARGEWRGYLATVEEWRGEAHLNWGPAWRLERVADWERRHGRAFGAGFVRRTLGRESVAEYNVARWNAKHPGWDAHGLQMHFFALHALRERVLLRARALPWLPKLAPRAEVLRRMVLPPPLPHSAGYGGADAVHEEELAADAANGANAASCMLPPRLACGFSATGRSPRTTRGTAP